MTEEYVLIPRDMAKRAALANFAGLTDEERAALDQWCYEQEMQRQRGVLLGDGTLWDPGRSNCPVTGVPCACCSECGTGAPGCDVPPTSPHNDGGVS